MIIKKFRTGEDIQVSNPRELKEVLKYCNPLMIKYYKQQLPQLDIKGYGQSIEIKVR
jgi:hypothetical protein